MHAVRHHTIYQSSARRVDATDHYGDSRSKVCAMCEWKVKGGGSGACQTLVDYKVDTFKRCQSVFNAKGQAKGRLEKSSECYNGTWRTQLDI